VSIRNRPPHGQSLDDPAGFDPLVDVVGIEADQFADLEEWDTALCDQTTDESLRHAKPSGDPVHWPGNRLFPGPIQRAGDGNRTRVFSLGSCLVGPPGRAADQRLRRPALVFLRWGLARWAPLSTPVLRCSRHVVGTAKLHLLPAASLFLFRRDAALMPRRLLLLPRWLLKLWPWLDPLLEPASVVRGDHQLYDWCLLESDRD